MKTLITGSGGFLGRSLIDLLAKKSINELILSGLSDNKNLHIQEKYKCDFSDFESVHSLFSKIRPEQIYHLVGSFSNDYVVDYKLNVISAKNIFDCCLMLKIYPKILLVGSSAEYGLVSCGDNPVSEEQPLNPVSVYGLTKAYQTLLMKYYCNVHEVNAVMARPFNIYGEGISNKLVVGRIYEQIKKVKSGEIPKIVLGNLEHKRDYISVEKVTEALFCIMGKGQIGEIYNIGSGKSIKISSLLETILSENGLDMNVVEQKTFNKPNSLDIVDMFANVEKLKNLQDL
jgi:GDP-4-dehydro-6-deoxy-D-mannose reductase